MKKTKEQKSQEKLAALLGLEAPTAATAQESHDKSMEAEAVLEYYENPKSFSHKDCKYCSRSFATRGSPVAYCSDHCRSKALEERLGISWRPLRSVEERWGSIYAEPLTVPHEALVKVQAIIAEEDTQDEEKPDPRQPPESLDVLDLLASLGIDLEHSD